MQIVLLNLDISERFFVCNGIRKCCYSTVVNNKVLAVIGYTAELPCHVNPPKPDDAPVLILWYRDIFGTPIYR